MVRAGKSWVLLITLIISGTASVSYAAVQDSLVIDDQFIEVENRDLNFTSIVPRNEEEINTTSDISESGDILVVNIARVKKKNSNTVLEATVKNNGNIPVTLNKMVITELDYPGVFLSFEGVTNKTIDPNETSVIKIFINTTEELENETENKKFSLTFDYN